MQLVEVPEVIFEQFMEDVHKYRSYWWIYPPMWGEDALVNDVKLGTIAKRRGQRYFIAKHIRLN